MDLVYENLRSFEDFKFFKMFEEEKDQDDMKIVKKCEDNFKQLKNDSKDNIQVLKKAVDRSLKVADRLNYPIKKTYALHNSNFAVAILDEEGTSYHEELAVFDIKGKSTEDGTPFLYSTDDKITIEAYKKFFAEVKNYIDDAKENYKKEIEKKKQQEKEKAKKEKLSKFLNEK
ncbi:MAG: hypothetical protein ACOC1O_00845 [bacterium]